MKTTRHAPFPCPACGLKMDASSDMDGKAIPKPGDFTLCIRCGCVLVFTDELIGRRAEQADLDALNDAERHALLVISAAIENVHRRPPT